MPSDKKKKPQKKKKVDKQKAGDEFFCPDCGAPLRHAEGCVMCPFCGWSKCG